MFQYTQYANTLLHTCSYTYAIKVHAYPGPNCHICRMSDWTMSRLFLYMRWSTSTMSVGIFTCCKASHFNNYWISSIIPRKPGRFVPLTMLKRTTYHLHPVLLHSDDAYNPLTFLNICRNRNKAQDMARARRRLGNQREITVTALESDASHIRS